MAYLARGYGRTRFHPQRLNRGLRMDEFYFKNIMKIEIKFAKRDKNMRWFAHYYAPVIRYWNPNLQISAVHSKDSKTKSQIIIHYHPQTITEENNDRNEGEIQILEGHNFFHDELFEQLMRVENGEKAIQLQTILLSNKMSIKHENSSATIG